GGHHPPTLQRVIYASPSSSGEARAGWGGGPWREPAATGAPPQGGRHRRRRCSVRHSGRLRLLPSPPPLLVSGAPPPEPAWRRDRADRRSAAPAPSASPGSARR